MKKDCIVFVAHCRFVVTFNSNKQIAICSRLSSTVRSLVDDFEWVKGRKENAKHSTENSFLLDIICVWNKCEVHASNGEVVIEDWSAFFTPSSTSILILTRSLLQRLTFSFRRYTMKRCVECALLTLSYSNWIWTL